MLAAPLLLIGFSLVVIAPAQSCRTCSEADDVFYLRKVVVLFYFRPYHKFVILLVAFWLQESLL